MLATRGPFEYLGFQFSGNCVRFRDSTLANLYRSIAGTLKLEARSLSKKYQKSSPEEILEKIDISRFLQRYGKIKEFNYDGDYKSTNFWSYAHRAYEKLGRWGSHLFRQMRNYKKFVRRTLLLHLKALP
jgi:hypothetical protein